MYGLLNLLISVGSTALPSMVMFQIRKEPHVRGFAVASFCNTDFNFAEQAKTQNQPSWTIQLLCPPNVSIAGGICSLHWQCDTWRTRICLVITLSFVFWHSGHIQQYSQLTPALHVGSLLAGMGGHVGPLGNEPWWTVCKCSTTLLSLQSHHCTFRVPFIYLCLVPPGCSFLTSYLLGYLQMKNLKVS